MDRIAFCTSSGCGYSCLRFKFAVNVIFDNLNVFFRVLSVRLLFGSLEVLEFSLLLHICLLLCHVYVCGLQLEV